MHHINSVPSNTRLENCFIRYKTTLALLKSISDECLCHVALQIDLKADVSTTLVTELSPKTDYSLTVHAVYPSRIGDSATITAQTSEWTHTHKLMHLIKICVNSHVSHVS